MRNTFSLRAALSAALLATLVSPAAVHAQNTSPTASAASPGDALSKADRLSADFEVLTLAGPYRDLRETGTVRLARPGLVRIEVDRFRRRNVSDTWQSSGNGSLAVRGTDGVGHLLTRHPQSSQYRKVESASPESLLGSLAPVLRVFFAAERTAPSSPPHAVGERDWEGARYQVYETDGPNNEKRTLYISPIDSLVHRALITSTGPGGRPVTRDIALRNFHIGAAAEPQTPPAIFAFTPPAEAIPVVAKAKPAVADGPTTLAVGAPAPDFTVEDRDGKPVRFSDLTRGKVTVLKFWATWCWPCNQSLPETEQLAAAHAGSDPVTVVAVALWDSRNAFRSWLEKKGQANAHIRFAFDPAPQGEDTGSKLYGVTATPTAFVIGRDGKIAAVIAGYSGPTPALADAVNRALGAENTTATTIGMPPASGSR